MIDVRRFGEIDGTPVYQAQLTSSTGVIVDILNFGASIRDWRVPVGGTLRPVVLGFDTFEPYRIHGQYFGAIVGRVANRIDNARFELGGDEFILSANDGVNILHGGAGGLSSNVWGIEPDTSTNRIVLSTVSADKEMGFPGRVEFVVSYQLVENSLRIELTARPDRATPISLAQHNYFNLGASGSILDHQFLIDANSYTAIDKSLIATGETLPVEGTIYDFRKPKTMLDLTGKAQVFDVNLVLSAGRDMAKPAATVQSPNADLTLKLFTDRPGLQVYNGANLDVDMAGAHSKKLVPYSGFCLEDQMLPGALSHAHFPSIICDPAQNYHHWCEIEIC